MGAGADPGTPGSRARRPAKHKRTPRPKQAPARTVTKPDRPDSLKLTAHGGVDVVMAEYELGNAGRYAVEETTGREQCPTELNTSARAQRRPAPGAIPRFVIAFAGRNPRLSASTAVGIWAARSMSAVRRPAIDDLSDNRDALPAVPGPREGSSLGVGRKDPMTTSAGSPLAEARGLIERLLLVRPALRGSRVVPALRDELGSAKRQWVLYLLLLVDANVVRELVPELVVAGLRPRDALLVREILGRLPRNVLQSHLSPVIRRQLPDAEDDEVRRMAELLKHLGLASELANLVAVAKVSDDPNIREVAADWELWKRACRRSGS